jgi:catechol 2,3-dioxygenase-like lactoylglutathione lyase family enzyme
MLSSMRSMGLVTLVVRDYDEVIRFYVEGLGFTLVEDTPQGDKRWVVLSAGGGSVVAAGQG